MLTFFTTLITTAHAGPRVELFGRVQLDWARAVDRPAEESGFEIRRARVAGKFYAHDLVWGKVDISLKKMAIADLYANLGPKTLSVRAGRQKMPTSHAYLESSRFIPFAERPMLVGVTAQDRTVGVMVHGKVGRFTYEVAGGENTPFDDTVQGTEAYVRGTFRPEDGVKIGVWGSVGRWVGFEPAFDTSTGYSWEGMEAALDGVVARQGVDGVALLTPVRVDAEVMAMQVGGADPLWVFGAYVDVLWMLTGEEQKVGKRVEPAKPIHEGGPGAFQLGARFEHITVRGAAHGDVEAVTGGLNWFPLKNVKVFFNATHSRLVKTSENSVQIRLQFEG